MAIRIESMAEPLPGYRLIERLGGGGFGEVWKAEAPGGLFKAIKFVYGDLEATDEDGARAGQEFKALKRVITVRHPFILSLERFDVIDGQLMIVTELADRTLWDRFRECRTQGLVGIPREELHRYLDDTAEALDLMNSEYQLQHLDIKPQNLFLVHTHVKVADFGLVKDLEGMLASVTGGVTPVYAAPETFEGKVSRFSDQYSLAIVYQELLTGQRPYTGTTLRQLVMQHCQGTPDLKSLPDRDRPIVLRALAKHHEDRYPNCRAFVNALRGATQEESSPAAKAKASPAPTGQVRAESCLPEEEKTQSNQSRSPVPQRTPDKASSSTPPPREPRLSYPSQPKGGPTETPFGRGFQGSTNQMPVPHEAAVEPTLDGVLAPAVVIGLGTLGLATLRQLRRETVDNFGLPEALPLLRLLHIDTDPVVSKCAVRGRDQVALRSNEVLLTKLHRPSHYLRPREGASGLECWFPAKMLYRMPRQQTACDVRALGRLAFVDNYKTIGRRLEIELEGCCSKQALEKAVRDSGLGLRTAAPRVYIVSSLADGTGSGMLLDLAFLVRYKLQELGHDSSQVVGICFLPPTSKDPRRTAELANTFATLTELNHFSAKQAVFSAQYELGDVRAGGTWFSWEGAPLPLCRFFTLPDGQGAAVTDGVEGGIGIPPSLAKTLAKAARIIFAELTTPLGHRPGEQAQKADALTTNPGGMKALSQQSEDLRLPLYQTVGIYRMVWPRRQLLEHAARIVCRRLVQRWMSKNAKPIVEPVKQWVQEHWDKDGFTADQLIGQYQQACETALGQAPESAFQAIHTAVAAALAPHKGKPDDSKLNVAAVMEALEQMEHLVGVPEECRPPLRAGEPSSYEPGSLETILQDVASTVVDQFEQKLAELAVVMIEDPHYRLAGAEEALRQFRGQVEQALQAHEELANELQQRATAIYQRIHLLTENPAQSTQVTTWKPPFARRAGGAAQVVPDLLELLRTYPKCRYQALIMHRITLLYVSLRGLLSDQLREIDFCRARLTDLAGLFGEPDIGNGPRLEPPAAGRFLSANGCKSAEDAIEQLQNSVGANELVELDTRIQGMLRGQFKALVHICMSSANLLKSLAPAMHKESRTFLRSRLGETHVAEVYLRHFQDGREDADARLEDDLAEAFENASPEVAASPPVSELNLLGVPEGPEEKRLRESMAKAIDGKLVVPVVSSDEITVYREHTLACLADLDQLGPLAQEAYDKTTEQNHCTPHSRYDITEWGTLAGERVEQPEM
jgi:eukaryotic-like serine/threonine-protein kinase